jgi:HK97 family phage portal protein
MAEQGLVRTWTMFVASRVLRPFGLTVKGLPPLTPLSARSSTWWPVIREPFTGAWQRNEEIRWDSVLAFHAVFACVTLIASDIAKLGLRLVVKDDNGIWSETESAAFSPVLRKPNRYQTRIKFIEQWLVSKLLHGNTYVLKQRDKSGIVRALYVLDPQRVKPLVSPDGAVYYELQRDDLSNIADATITVPAKEIIHDTMVALWHPLIGVSPIYACGLAAAQGLAIQNNSERFFATGSKPGGVLTAPGAIGDETAKRLKAYWETNFSGENVGRVAVLGDGLKYEAMTVNADDAQLIEQLKWTGENVCSCFHVPPFMVGIGPAPPYANVEPLLQQYYSQCLQSLIINLETTLDEGLGLHEKIEGRQFGTEFDPDDLIWLDTATRTKAAADGIASAGMKINEARKKYYGLPPVEGGDSVYLQQQYFSVAALAERDANKPFSKPAEPTAPAPAQDDEDEDDIEEMAAFFSAINQKLIEEGLHEA